MHIAIIGTYPPTRCGIATFTADVEQALLGHGVQVEVIAVDPERPAAHRHSIDSSSVASYAGAARWLNSHDIDLVLVQHEFGIHGGADGAHLLELTRRLDMPYVVTLHTILTTFTAGQSAVLESLCHGAAAVTVFTPTARRMVLEQELVNASAVTVVPHGAPLELYRHVHPRRLRDELGLADGTPVLSTFGLLSPGKGLETALAAMRSIVREVPDACYVIAGRTHPGVQRHEGECYRAALEAKVHEWGLAGNVRFVDRFLSVGEIAELLSITRVFLTPYRNEDQIVSGALTFAVAAGCPVVSTPYRYALDMVRNHAGIVVPFDDPAALADATLTLCHDGPARTCALRRAATLAGTLSWPAVGRTLRHVLADAIAGSARERAAHRAAVVPAADHLLVLLDDTSVMQHAAYRLPRLEEGYCVDDAGRMLPIAARLARLQPDHQRWAVAVPRLLAFLRAAALDGRGSMRNFMSWDRRWLDEPHGGDHVERTVWGLGELLAEGDHVDEVVPLLHTLMSRPAAQLSRREAAYRALGVLAAADHLDVGVQLSALHRVVQQWRPPTDQGSWLWPEQRLTYDNARVPEVMIRLGHRMGDDALVARGVASFIWLEQRCRRGDHYRFPGHRGLAPGDDIGRSGDEQPLEAAAMIDAALALLQATGDRWGIAAADRAWSWFLGNNRVGRAPGSTRNGACNDALTADGLNLNCGAESTLAFHRAAHAIARVHATDLRGAAACSNVTPTIP